MKRRQLLTGSGLTLTGALVAPSLIPAPAAAAPARRTPARHPRLPDEAIAARRRILGTENVDPNTGALPEERVVFSWLSNASFAAAIGGRLLYLDTYVTRLEVERGRTPLVIADLVDARPDAILLGHGHSDHADNAAYIAARTGATIYASEETCGVMAADLARMKADPRINGDPRTRIAPDAVVRTVPVTTAGSVPGTQTVRLGVLEPYAQVVAFRHLHSVAVPSDPDYPPPRTQILVDPRDAVLFPRGIPLTPDGDPLPGQIDITTGGSPGGPVSIYFHVTLRHGGQFSFGWQNTAGALKEGKGNGWDGIPVDGERIRRRLAELPPADLHLATASTANYANNGLRDLIDYQSVIRPRIFVPNHLTSGTLTREASSLAVYAGYLEQLDLMAVPASARPDVRWVIDPVDYLTPLAFDTDDHVWADPRKKDRIRALDRLPMARPSATGATVMISTTRANDDHECDG